LRDLAGWLGPDFSPARPDACRRVADRLSRAVAHLDEVLDRQVNAILHHPRFQQLEASWRGLHYLVYQVPLDSPPPPVKIKILNISWRELVLRDLERALEFDQSQLFRKVYDEQFGMPGGEPFGMLLADYEVHLQPSGEEHPTDDVEALTLIAQVAAAAFCPFVAAAHPSLLDLPNYGTLQRSVNLDTTYQQLKFTKWNRLRGIEDSRFVNLVLPRVLMRRPYADDGSRKDGFRFREDVEAPDGSGYLWGNAVYALGAVVARTFADSGWVAAIRGARPGQRGGGLVTGLPVQCFSSDRPGVVPKIPTEVLITDVLDKELADYGFLPLCACPDTQLAAFYSSASVQEPRNYTTAEATANARLSVSLQNMLCVSRFAHYLKVMARDRGGQFQTASDYEDMLRKWVRGYTIGNDNADAELKARFPLRDAQVSVREDPRNPGRFLCDIQLQPHFQLEQVTTSVRLRTALTTGRTG
jgi:type VI secretion system ImpC/EvpB family protein